ncbi:MAG: SOS response-associated peptidase [Candidatus Saccharimonadales bacterium]
MSIRYALYDTKDLSNRFTPDAGLPKGIKPHYNINPTDSSPVVLIRDHKPTIELMKWGFIPHRAKDTNGVFRYKTFNAKSESIFDKSTWQSVIRTQRCLVPANGFYEWQTREGKKQPHFIHTADNKLFAFAGIYGSWADPDGREWGTFAIVTVDANDDMSPITDRMPVLVHKDDEATWLDPSVDDATSLYGIMRACPAGVLQHHTVSSDIDSRKIDKPSLIQPL